MKKICIYILICATLFSGFSLQQVDAQTATGGSRGGQSSQAVFGAQRTVTPSSTSGGFDFLEPVYWISEILGWVGYLILQLMSLVLGLTGILLNFVIKTTIIDFSENIKTFTGINVVWKTMRDLINMSFIFVLVYQGILMIVSKGDTTKVRRFIISIILASILINFSLFFTKVIIDASNVVTVSVYNRIVNTGEGDTDFWNRGLSNAYIQSLGLQGFWSGNAVDSINQFGSQSGSGKTKGANMLTISLMGSILFLITSFIFLAVSCMLIVRYIVLIIILATSPLGFMKGLFPYLDKKSTEWWNSLMGQAIFPAVFMLMTWIILTLISPENGFTSNLNNNQWIALVDPSSNTSTQALGAAAANKNGPISLLFNFAVVIGLSVASIIVAKNYATQGAGAIGNMINNATSFAGNRVMGGAARLGRSTVGAFGDKVSQNEWLKDRASKGGALGWASMKTLQGGDRVARSSFDVRSGIVGENITKQTGINFGKNTVKDGRRGDLKLYSDKKVAEAKLLKTSDETVAAATERLNSKEFNLEEETRFKGSELGKAYAAAKTASKESKEQFDVAQKERDAELAKRKEFEDKKKTLFVDTTEIEKEKATLLEERAITTDTTEIDKKIAGLDEKLAKANENQREIEEIDQNLAEIDKSLEEKDKTFNILKQQYETKKAEFDKLTKEKDLYSSDVRDKLIAQKGGQQKIEKDGQLIQRAVEGISKQRVDAFAKTQDPGSTGTHIASYIGSAVVGSPLLPIFFDIPRTKADRSSVSKAIKKTIETKKTPKEQMKEILEEAEKKEQEEREKQNASKTEETPKTT